MALMSFDIFGLHSDWWANLFLLARVLMECVNDATFCTSRVGGCGVGVGGCGEGVVVSGNVHKSVDASL
jgi:hypothetical protein